MDIKNFINMSLTDWDGRVSAVLFLGGCNFMCPFCHNWSLVLNPDAMESLDPVEVFKQLELSSDWLDGVVITGGEPTCDSGLPELIRNVRELGLKVKLDTNGSNPKVLRELIHRKLLDFVSMDVKNSREKYSETAGVHVDIDDVLESISLLKGFGRYEFRTTVVPGLVDTKDLEEICELIKGSKLYVLQRFHPENIINREFSEIAPQSDEEMEGLAAICSVHVPTKWRG